MQTGWCGSPGEGSRGPAATSCAETHGRRQDCRTDLGARGDLDLACAELWLLLGCSLAAADSFRPAPSLRSACPAATKSSLSAGDIARSHFFSWSWPKTSASDST